MPQYLWVCAFLDVLFVLVVVVEALLSLHLMNLDVELRRSHYQYSSTHSDLMVHWANHRMHLMVYMNTNMDLVLMDLCRSVTCRELKWNYVTYVCIMTVNQPFKLLTYKTQLNSSPQTGLPYLILDYRLHMKNIEYDKLGDVRALQAPTSLLRLNILSIFLHHKFCN